MSTTRLEIDGDFDASARREVKARSFSGRKVEKLNNGRLSLSQGNLAVGHMHFDDVTTKPAARQTQGTASAADQERFESVLPAKTDAVPGVGGPPKPLPAVSTDDATVEKPSSPCAAGVETLEDANGERPQQLSSLSSVQRSCDAEGRREPDGVAATGSPAVNIADRARVTADAAEAAPTVPPHRNIPPDAEASVVAQDAVVFQREVVDLCDDLPHLAREEENFMEDGHLNDLDEAVQALPDNPLQDIVELGVNVYGRVGNIDWKPLVSIWNVIDRRAKWPDTSIGISDRTLNQQEMDMMYQSVDMRNVQHIA